MMAELLQCAVPAQQPVAGLRALSQNRPIHPASVQRYLQSKVGATLADVYHAMVQRADSRSPARLAAEAYHLYEQFRPQVSAGAKGWGAVGLLRLETIRTLAEAATGEAGRRL